MGFLRSTPLPVALLLGAFLLSGLVPSAGAHGLALSVPLAATPPPGGPSALAPPGTVVSVPAASLDPASLFPPLPWESANTVRVESGTPWVPLMLDGQRVDSSAAPVRGNIQFWCPPSNGGTTINDGSNTMTMRAGCPFRIVDDADLMGSAQVAVNENDPNSLAFFSLHGAGTEQGPTPRSRDPNPEGTGTLTGLSHTTFTSQDHGVSWFDNPWGTDGFGEHVTGVMDHDGNLYIGALWSKRLGDGHFDYTVKVYKEQDGRFKISNYQPSKTFSNRAAGNTITQANLVYVPEQAVFAVPLDNGTGNRTGNATEPAGQGDLGNYTDPDEHGFANGDNDTVVLVWHEQALDYRNSTTRLSSWIDAAWTDTTARDNWTRLADRELIGPCMAASNPISWNGKAYVACVADAGYTARSRARIGDVDVWSIDPATGKTRLEEFTGLVGGEPRLAGRPDGFMALTTTRVVSEDEVRVGLSFGWYGHHWDNALGDVGGILHTIASNTATSGLPPGTPGPPPAGNKVREARITAMALTDENPQDSLFLVYMERVDVPGGASDPDPNNPFISPDAAIEYKKIVATFTKCEGPTNVYDLQLGVARHPFTQSIVGNATGVFDDLQDGMQAWTDPSTGEERIYFAYGDHGVIQYGALVASGSQPTTACPNPVPAPFLPQAAIPAGLGAASPYTALVGSAVGLTATAMVGYLLTVKRKSASALAAQAKK